MDGRTSFSCVFWAINSVYKAFLILIWSRRNKLYKRTADFKGLLHSLGAGSSVLKVCTEIYSIRFGWCTPWCALSSWFFLRLDPVFLLVSWPDPISNELESCRLTVFLKETLKNPPLLLLMMNRKAAEHTQKAPTCFFWIHELTEASWLFTVILIDRDRAMMSFSFRAHHASFASSQRFVSGLGSHRRLEQAALPLHMKVMPQRLTTSINPGAYMAWQVAQVAFIHWPSVDAYRWHGVACGSWPADSQKKMECSWTWWRIDSQYTLR